MDPIRSIVVPTDFSEGATEALALARAMAMRWGAALHVVHAMTFPTIASPYEVSIPDAIRAGVEQGARERLQQLQRELEAIEGIPAATVHLAESPDAVQAIDEAVSRHSADLVVMGTHGYSGLVHAFLGSVAERTIRRLACPVLAVKPGVGAAERPIATILVPVDFSPHSTEAVRWAARLADEGGASLHLLHAIDFAPAFAPALPPEAVEIESRVTKLAAAQLTALANRLKSEAPKVGEVQTHLLRGVPASGIVDQAEDLRADLIVMGTHGHTGLTHLLIGSIAEKTLRHAGCPVLVVKEPDPSNEG